MRLFLRKKIRRTSFSTYYKDDRLVSGEGFGGTIKLDNKWNAVDKALNLIGVGTTRKRRRVSEEADNSDLYEDIKEFEDVEDVEEGNGDYDEVFGEFGSKMSFSKSLVSRMLSGKLPSPPRIF
ncbi:hypothetical protein GcM1_173026 [Golovinomyces cichoracearum]|uniref:Uncharacterized protein n=1 Tax=Golovinomyces cichoracearum TaxID=62708 RepID=A0A420J6A0_9PEZI|nr:hypothetical protein GcM1_173026 [Golovinomyces cichoracearum]